MYFFLFGLCSLLGLRRDVDTHSSQSVMYGKLAGMIVKMIQNLESKMELQINSLETKIEKMQEMFNKDLEETKKSQ